jgi:hypothetical protein
VILAALVFTIPEPVVRRAAGLAALRPRIRVPRETRREFFAALPAIVAGWSITGLFLALAPALVRDVLHVRFGAAGGLSITMLFIANTAGGLWAARYAARSATLLGAVLLALGAAGLAAALLFTSPPVFIGGSIVAGLGVGLTFNGTLRGISATTTAKSRSEVFSAVFVVSYAALGLPSLAPARARAQRRAARRARPRSHARTAIPRRSFELTHVPHLFRSRPAILGHHPDLAASPPVRYKLEVARS